MTLQNTKRFDDVRPGETLPELAIPITVGDRIVATADGVWKRLGAR